MFMCKNGRTPNTRLFTARPFLVESKPLSGVATTSLSFSFSHMKAPSLAANVAFCADNVPTAGLRDAILLERLSDLLLFLLAERLLFFLTERLLYGML